MRNFRRLYLGMILSLFCGLSLGKPYEKIVLKNGTELEGYISIQYPGKKVTFMSEKAMVYLTSSVVESISSYDSEWSALPSEWQHWADENPASVKTVGGKKYLTLSDIVMRTEPDQPDTLVAKKDSVDPYRNIREVPPRGVKILEKGAVIKYLDFAKTFYDIPWEDILMIKRYERSALDLTGVIDVVELCSGNVLEGQIIEQLPGKQVRLLGNDGIVEVIDLKQIAVQKKKKLNPNQPLSEQSPLLEIVCTKQGKKITGVIVEQTYNRSDGDFLLIEEKGKTVKENSGNVVEIRKIPNPDYRFLTDLLVKKDEIWINRQKGEKALVDEEESVMIVNEKSVPVTVELRHAQDTLTVEQQDNIDNRNIILLKLTQIEIKKRGECHAFTYEDLVTQGSRPFEVEVSKNQTLKMLYTIGEGHYILYKPKEKTAVYLIARTSDSASHKKYKD